MTGHEQEMTGFDEAMGPYEPYLHNEMPSFGVSEPSLPPDASNTLDAFYLKLHFGMYSTDIYMGID